MKKILCFILVAVLAVGLLSLGIGCKTTTPEATATGETTAAATETTAAATETTAAESVVAAEKELYIFPCFGWGMEVLRPWLWGGYTAAKTFGITFEYYGPEDFDSDKALAALETAIAKKPDGILWCALGIGEDKLLTDYYNSGGMIAGMNGTNPGTYPQTTTVGTDNFYYGEQQAKWMLNELGENFKYAIMTLPEADNHIKRMDGVKSVLASHKGIELVGIASQTTDQTQAAANAAALLAANPDLDAFICTSAQGGAACGRAVKEAGLEPGSIKIIAGDMDKELLDLIDEGYVSASLAQSFPAEAFWAISAMHFIKINATPTSNNDKEAGFAAGPVVISTSLPFITKENIQYFRDIKPPEGFNLY